MLNETNLFLNAITNKPSLVVLVTQSSFVVSMLAWIGVLTPLLGFIAAIAGAIVGIHSVVKLFKSRKHAKELKTSKVKPSHK